MSPRTGLDVRTIVTAAAEIADSQGFDEVSLASLAKKLGVRPPSLYNHVDGLPELRKRLAIHGIEQLHRAMTQAAVGRSGDDAVRAVCGAYVAFARERPGLYEATFRAPNLHDPDVGRAGELIIDLMIRILRAYRLEGDDALHAVRGLRSLVHGFTSLEQKGAFGMALDRDETLRRLVDTFLAGLHLGLETKRAKGEETSPETTL